MESRMNQLLDDVKTIIVKDHADNGFKNYMEEIYSAINMVVKDILG